MENKMIEIKIALDEIHQYIDLCFIFETQRAYSGFIQGLARLQEVSMFNELYIIGKLTDQLERVKQYIYKGEVILKSDSLIYSMKHELEKQIEGYQADYSSRE